MSDKISDKGDIMTASSDLFELISEFNFFSISRIHGAVLHESRRVPYESRSARPARIPSDVPSGHVGRGPLVHRYSNSFLLDPPALSSQFRGVPDHEPSGTGRSYSHLEHCLLPHRLGDLQIRTVRSAERGAEFCDSELCGSGDSGDWVGDKNQ